jgi:hypothetical protein
VKSWDIEIREQRLEIRGISIAIWAFHLLVRKLKRSPQAPLVWSL